MRQVMRWAMLRIVIAASLLVIGGILSLSCSREESSSEDRREMARQQLEARLAANEGMETEWHGKYLVEGCRRGLQLLASGQPIRDPVLLAAGFSRAKVDGLALVFFDPEFETRGIAIENDRGYSDTFPILNWTADDRNWYSSTILRTTGCRISIQGNPHPKLSVTADGHTVGADIKLPSDALKGQVTVYLVKANGERTKGLKAYVDPAFVQDERGELRKQ